MAQSHMIRITENGCAKIMNHETHITFPGRFIVLLLRCCWREIGWNFGVCNKLRHEYIFLKKKKIRIINREMAKQVYKFEWCKVLPLKLMLLNLICLFILCYSIMIFIYVVIWLLTVYLEADCIA